MARPTANQPIGVALLGSTGSIGRQTIDVLSSADRDRFRVVAMAAGSNEGVFAGQVTRLRPSVVAMASSVASERVAVPAGTAWIDAPDAMEQMAVREDVDLVIVATGGVVSLRPVLAALTAGKIVATANKETLVAGGHLVMPLARARATEMGRRAADAAMASPLAWLRPIDSEHSAIWQCLVGERADEVRRLILTASGGPFRTWSASQLEDARPEDAMAHPTWDMGAKITIDSATLMNKGLEVIEAHWLYDVAYEDIDVIIHPQSLIHSLVEFVDGSTKAQLGLPDMRIPIQYAVSYPLRYNGPAPRLELTEQPYMSFEAPDEQRFPALPLARAAGAAGPGSTAVLIAADDVAVERYLVGSLPFNGIVRLVESALARFGSDAEPQLAELEGIDAEVRAWARKTAASQAARA